MKIRYRISVSVLSIGMLLFGSNTGQANDTAVTLIQSLDSGGGRQSGGAVTIDASLGFIGGRVSASADQSVVRVGFAGQLFDVSTLSITAPSTDLDEGRTLQLAVDVVTLDDDTTLTLDASEIAWTIQSGPIASVDFDGMVTATLVSPDTSATIQGAYLSAISSLDLLIRDLGDDNFTTDPYNFAGDGIPDQWQITYFPPGEADASPTADGDDDGLVNLAEYFFDSDPTSTSSGPQSGPQLSIESAGGPDEFLMLTFRRRASFQLPVNTEVQASGDLSNASAWSAGPILISTTGPDEDGLVTEVWCDTVTVSSASQRFLRLLLSVQQP